MEKKEIMVLSMEEAVGSSSSFGDCNPNYSFPLSSVFEYHEVEKSSLGFMELLGVNGQVDDGSFQHLPPQLFRTDARNKWEHSNQQQQPPTTPNSSSTSSASSEALTTTDEPSKTTVDQKGGDHEHPKTKNQ